MPKKKEKKRCQYKRWPDDDYECSHDYFATYVDPEVDEETDYCIFHAPIELKESEEDEFWEAFDIHFEKANGEYEAAESEEDREEVVLDCAGFIFPDTGDKFADKYKEFLLNVRFYKAVFAGRADFSNVTFKRDAVFSDATFKDKANFGPTSFVIEADSREVTFAGGAEFWDTTFESSANFVGVVFASDVNFGGADFWSEVNFSDTIFVNIDYFGYLVIDSSGGYGRVKFKRVTKFSDAVFEGKADFQGAKITGKVGFNDARFAKPVSFNEAQISGELAFPETQFAGDADFRDILTYLLDEESERADPDAPPGALLFDNAYFHRPERVQIGGKETDLGQWSFKDTNVEKVNFVNEKWDKVVRWRREYKEAPFKLRFWPFKLKGRKVIYDEILANEDKDKPDRERRVTWEDAGQVYRRLRKKFEGELAYELTSDFHYGQMECRRFNSDRPLLHPDRVVAFLYKIVSGYGERFGLPLLWLGGTLLLFTGVYLLLGFEFEKGVAVDWDWFSNSRPVGAGAGRWWAELWIGLCYSVKSALSLGVAADGYTGLVAGLEKVSVVAFATFFILALRRRFKK